MVKEMLGMKTWAVIGASENKEKFGWKIYKKLKDNGYKVFPISPNYETIDGDKCYKNLSELPEKPDVIDMVISPKYGMNTINEASELGIKYIWLQPGTYNDELLALIEEKGLNSVKACVLVELGK